MPAAVDAAVVVQDDAARSSRRRSSLPDALELRQLRQRVDRRPASATTSSTRCVVVGSALVIVMILGSMCAYVLARFQLPRQPGHLLPDAGRADVPDLPGDRAAVLQLLQNLGLLNTLPGPDRHLRRLRPAVHRVLPLSRSSRRLPDEIAEAAAIDGAGEWRDVLPGDAADGAAGDRVGGDLQLPRAVEPVPAARWRSTPTWTTTCWRRAWRRSPRRPATRWTSARCSRPW